MLQKDSEVKPKKIPLTKDQSLMEPSNVAPTVDQIRSCQKAVGEVLWLTTRARPDIMYAVSRMGSSSTKAPAAVLAAASQLKGYLQATSDEGLKFEVKEGEIPILTVYTDVGFAPDAQESHGSFVVLLGTTPIFWRSGRQSYITLSTAEAELTEIVEGMIAGESIYALKLITIAASIAASKAEKEEEKAEEAVPFEVLIAYTLGIIVLTLVAQRLWNAAVRGVNFIRRCVLANLGSLSMNAVEKEEEIPEGDQSGPLLTLTGQSIESSGGAPLPSEAPLPLQAPLPPEAPLPLQAPLPPEAPPAVSNEAQTGTIPERATT
eukprot:s71_g11.t1